MPAIPRLRRMILLALGALAIVPVVAAAQAYDESADAKAEIRLALDDARKADVPVLVVFGANWCPDCRVLDLAFKTGASAPLIAKNFRVVKVDVGRFNRNMDVAEAWDVPVRKGIPAVAVVSAQGKVLYATRSGELADARTMGDSGIHEFFRKVSRR